MMPWLGFYFFIVALTMSGPVQAAEAQSVACPSQAALVETGRIHDVGSGNHTQLIASQTGGSSIWASHFGLQCSYSDIEFALLSMSYPPDWWKEFASEGFRAEVLLKGVSHVTSQIKGRAPASLGLGYLDSVEPIGNEWLLWNSQVLGTSVENTRPALSMRTWIESHCAPAPVAPSTQATPSPESVAPTGVELCLDYETGTLRTEGCSTIWVRQVGQRWNSNKNQCEVLLQFPWGDDCDGLKNFEFGTDCTHGRLWVAKERL